jgi:hypothetical protein
MNRRDFLKRAGAALAVDGAAATLVPDADFHSCRVGKSSRSEILLTPPPPQRKLYARSVSCAPNVQLAYG